MFAAAVLSIALLASSVSASTIAARHPLNGMLQIRQSNTGFDPSEIPSQCQSQCLSTEEVLGNDNTCTDVSCLCTTNVNTGFQQCLDCVLQVEGSTPALAQQAQAALAQYEDACSSNGVTLPSLSISGATPGATQTSVASGSLPAQSQTQSQSIFFSTSGGAGTSTTPIQHTTITALSTASTPISSSSAASTSSGSSSGGSSSGGGPLAASGAMSGATVGTVLAFGVAVAAGAFLGF